MIWLGAARRMGFTVARSAEVYASYDGRGMVTLGDASTLDPDDCLAQMIFHEVCHSLVEGREGLTRPDWGLDNRTERDVPREHATLRLQAALAGAYGLRRVLAPTTDFREFYDTLPAEPLADGAELSVTVARRAAALAGEGPWGPHLGEALAATARVAREAMLAEDPTPASPGDGGALPLLWGQLETPVPRHPSGELATGGAETCATCAWRVESSSRGGRVSSSCRATSARRIDPEWPSCVRWEPALDCQTCGACCREAYGSVEVGRRDPAVRLHPELIVVRPTYLEVRREGERCAALGGGPPAGEPYAPPGGSPPYVCSIYDTRPRTCRDFERGGRHCIVARRRVGLTV